MEESKKTFLRESDIEQSKNEVMKILCRMTTGAAKSILKAANLIGKNGFIRIHVN